MPRNATFPPLFNDSNHIDISFLKKHGYLENENFRKGVISWLRHGIPYSRITVFTDTYNYHASMTLSYTLNGKPIEYKIQLVKKPSNLGKGNIWYFRCPHTKKLCRRLYDIGDYFLHRTAYKNVFYESQLVAKKNRGLFSYIRLNEMEADLYEVLYSKHFTKYYKGKPTKKYLSLKKKLDKLGNYNVADYEKILENIL